MGLVVAAQNSLPQTLGELSFKSFNFLPFFCMKMDKKLSASGGGGALLPDSPPGAVELSD